MEQEVELNLSNICGGGLEKEFQRVYPALVGQLTEGNSAKLAITLEFKKVENTTTMCNIKYQVKPTFPARAMAAICAIGAEGKLKTEPPKEDVNQLILLREAE